MTDSMFLPLDYAIQLDGTEKSISILKWLNNKYNVGLMVKDFPSFFAIKGNDLTVGLKHAHEVFACGITHIWKTEEFYEKIKSNLI